MINNITSFPKHSHHPIKTKRANTTNKIKKKYQKIKKKVREIYLLSQFRRESKRPIWRKVEILS
jgi:hypothetical protein